MTSLTKKQKNIYDFFRKYRLENGISPTIEEIKREFGLKAVSTVHEHLKTLKAKGYISGDQGVSRGLELKKDIKAIVTVPILGRIAAGDPIESIEDQTEMISISLQDNVNDRTYYALRVAGDSMIDEGIFDGDTVIIKKQASAENGQTVVAIIDDNCATLKRIYRENGKFRLQPANQNLLPLYRKNVEIRGVVVQVIRNMENKVIKKNQPGKNKFRTIDLFAGIGGIRTGFERQGFETVFSNDFEANCKHTYDLNFNTSKLIVEDIRKINTDDLPEFDFLLGGFPCQAFSIAGYREGFKDKKDRGNLFFDVARIIEKRKPTGFLLENVKNLKNHDDGRTFEVIEKTLTDLGYKIRAKVLNSMDYGNVPQNRERIYIVGFKDQSHADKFKFPDPIKLTTTIKDILDSKVPEKFYYNGKPLFKRLKNHVKDENKVYQWRRQYVRENKKGVCPTLTANMGMGGHNVPIIKDKNGIRKLTPSECAKIQGFPKDFILPNIADSALYKQFGNSVTVTVIERIAKEIRKAVEQ